MALKQRATICYFWYGVAFGLLFPLVATTLDVLQRGLSVSLDTAILVQRSQMLHWMIDTAPLFLGVFAALAGWRQDRLTGLYAALLGRNTELEQANRRAELAEENARLNAENASLYEETQRQLRHIQRAYSDLDEAQQTIRALSIPLIPVRRGVLVVPLVGTCDERRFAEVCDHLLHGVVEHRTHVVIVDCTGASDSVAPGGLVRLVQSLQLLGVHLILTGVRPCQAQRLVEEGAMLQHITTARQLADGVDRATHLLRDEGLDRVRTGRQ